MMRRFGRGRPRLSARLVRGCNYCHCSCGYSRLSRYLPRIERQPPCRQLRGVLGPHLLCDNSDGAHRIGKVVWDSATLLRVEASRDYFRSRDFRAMGDAAIYRRILPAPGLHDSWPKRRPVRAFGGTIASKYTWRDCEMPEFALMRVHPTAAAPIDRASFGTSGRIVPANSYPSLVIVVAPYWCIRPQFTDDFRIVSNTRAKAPPSRSGPHLSARRTARA